MCWISLLNWIYSVCHFYLFTKHEVKSIEKQKLIIYFLLILPWHYRSENSVLQTFIFVTLNFKFRSYTAFNIIFAVFTFNMFLREHSTVFLSHLFKFSLYVTAFKVCALLWKTSYSHSSLLRARLLGWFLGFT